MGCKWTRAREKGEVEEKVGGFTRGLTGRVSGGFLGTKEVRSPRGSPAYFSDFKRTHAADGRASSEGLKT